MKTYSLVCFVTLIFFSACRRETGVAGPPVPDGITDPQFFFKGNMNGQLIDIKAGTAQYSTLPYTGGMELPYSGPDVLNLQIASKFDFVSLQIVAGYEVNVFLGLPHRDSIATKEYPVAAPDFLSTTASIGKAAVRITDMGNLGMGATKNWYSYAIDNFGTADRLTVTRVEDYTFRGLRMKKVHFTISCNLFETPNQTYSGMPFKRLTASGVMAF